jgi:hypothetical protein
MQTNVKETQLQNRFHQIQTQQIKRKHNAQFLFHPS